MPENIPVDTTESLKEKRARLQQQYEEYTCPISFEFINNPIKTPCDHYFEQLPLCLEMISARHRGAEECCPLCRTSLTRFSPSSIDQLKLEEITKFKAELNVAFPGFAGDFDAYVDRDIQEASTVQDSRWTSIIHKFEQSLNLSPGTSAQIKAQVCSGAKAITRITADYALYPAAGYTAEAVKKAAPVVAYFAYQSTTATASMAFNGLYWSSGKVYSGMSKGLEVASTCWSDPSIVTSEISKSLELNARNNKWLSDKMIRELKKAYYTSRCARRSPNKSKGKKA